MDIKLIAIDLDDTLLSGEWTISAANKEAVFAAAKKGVRIVIATGRRFTSARRYIDELNITEPAICAAGSEIVDAITGEIIVKHYIEAKIAKAVMKFAINNGVHIHAYRNDTFLYEKDNKWIESYRMLSGLKPVVTPGLSDDMDFETVKLLIITDANKVPELLEAAHERFGDILDVTSSKREYIEFYNSAASKGESLRHIAESHGLSGKNVMAIGDSLIDISMLEYAGIGVAMANSLPDTINAADFITKSNEEDGVAHAINKFILEA